MTDALIHSSFTGTSAPTDLPEPPADFATAHELDGVMDESELPELITGVRDQSNPSVRFRLPGGVRVHAIGRVTSHTHLSFRMFVPGLDTISDLQAAGMFGADLAAVLSASASVREPLGIIFAGGTGVGKTTL